MDKIKTEWDPSDHRIRGRQKGDGGTTKALLLALEKWWKKGETFAQQ